MTTIAGKKVLLTGASRGIGVSIAQALAREQATIVGVSRSQAGLDRVGEQVTALGGQWVGISFDLRQLEELPLLVKQTSQLIGVIDILINNAGQEIYRAFQDYSNAEVHSILSTNLIAAMELSRLLLPKMLHQDCGHIVNITSLSAKKGHPYDSIYSASKAGLLMWSDAVRQELAGTGVKISAICPGYVSQTGMLADTGVPAPIFSGTSTPKQVAQAVVKAIDRNQAEVMINQDLLTESLTKLMLLVWQIFPKFGDAIYRWIGVVKLNQMRSKKSSQTTLNTKVFSQK